MCTDRQTMIGVGGEGGHLTSVPPTTQGTATTSRQVNCRNVDKELQECSHKEIQIRLIHTALE